MFRIPHGSTRAELFVLELDNARALAVTERELLHVSQSGPGSLIAYPKRAEGPTVRRWGFRTLDASGSPIWAIATAGELVAVAREDDVLVVPIDGSPRWMLAMTTSTSIVDTDGRRVVWRGGGGPRRPERIMEAPIRGGEPRVVADAGCSVKDVAVDESGVYWLCSGGAVRALASGATEPETLAEGEPGARVLTTDVDAVYWVTDDHEGRSLWKVGKRGGELTELVPRTGRGGERSNVDKTQVFGDRVYFNAGDAIWEVGVDGSAPRIVAEVETEDSDVATFAVGDDGIYISADIRLPQEGRPRFENCDDGG